MESAFVGDVVGSVMLPPGVLGDGERKVEGTPNGSTMNSRPSPLVVVISRGFRRLSELTRLSRIGFSQCLSCPREPRHRLNASIPSAPASRPTTMPPTPAPIAAGTVDDL